MLIIIISNTIHYNIIFIFISRGLTVACYLGAPVIDHDLTILDAVLESLHLTFSPCKSVRHDQDCMFPHSYWLILEKLEINESFPFLVSHDIFTDTKTCSSFLSGQQIVSPQGRIISFYTAVWNKLTLYPWRWPRIQALK